jgi:hypothetical protein
MRVFLPPVPQNVYESMCGLIQHLSELGMALHSIRNVEALMAI